MFIWHAEKRFSVCHFGHYFSSVFEFYGYILYFVANYVRYLWYAEMAVWFKCRTVETTL